MNLNNIRISLLFAWFIFSLMIFDGGRSGMGLNMIAKLWWLVLYLLPLILLEIGLKSKITSGHEKLKANVNLSVCAGYSILLSLKWAILSLFLWESGFFLIAGASDYDAIGLFFLAPLAYLFFGVLNFVFSLIVCLSIKNNSKLFLKSFFVFAILLSLVLLGYGVLNFARCDFAGCSNGDYLIARAMKSGDPDVCKLAGSKFPERGLFAPSSYRLSTLIGNVNSDECYYRLASKINSLDVCEKAGEQKVLCYEDLAVNLCDITICNKLPTRAEWEKLRYKYSEAYREHCYKNFYMNAGDILLKCSK
ncbi:MAG: hypothetical protein YFSK_6330 [Candidatus Yanofskyibacterium parasiticum]|nr:MAG: hypothetical protein YFSK_6330 [Candidatus Yanofskybacteria bacterium]